MINSIDMNNVKKLVKYIEEHVDHGDMTELAEEVGVDEVWLSSLLESDNSEDDSYVYWRD